MTMREPSGHEGARRKPSKSHHGDMASRGVSRPMSGSHKEGQGNASGGMGHDDRRQMLVSHHRQTLWVYWVIILLGVWLVSSPASLGHLNEAQWVDPSGGRGVWFGRETHTELRAWLMTWSDVISGGLLVVFGWRSLTPNRPISLWLSCFVGLWLSAAPLLFWAPTVSAYLNDTVVGVLVMALTILIPGMPNMINFMTMGPPTPKGWTYNPSSWPQRWVMIVLGLLGWLVSRYLAAFQLGYTSYVWDPFFGFAEGTRQVLNSQMSHSLPISDAGLGAFAYTLEFLMGWMGGVSRWRTMPWMVTFFGILVIPLGLTHILLVASQPLVVGHWCSMCILAALIMLPMIPLEIDEVVAMLQHLGQAKRRGDRGGSLWAIFWKGGAATDATPDTRTPDLAELPKQPLAVFRASIWGMSFPPALIACAVLGVIVLFLPYTFGVSKPASDVAHLSGSLIVTISVISMGEVLRIGRFLNVLICIGMAAAVWFVGHDVPLGFRISVTLAAVLGILLSLPRGKVVESYGTWDRWIK